MAGNRIANPATRDESPETEQPAVVEWNAKRRRLILRVFNTKTVDRQQHEAARGPTPLSTTESSNSPDQDAVVGPGDKRYQPNSLGPQPPIIDTQYGNSASAFQSNGLGSKYKQFGPVRTAVGGEDYDKRNRAEKPAFDSVVGNTITNTGGRLKHDSTQGVDLGGQYRAYVIETRPNFQSNESETVDYYGGTKRSFLQRPDHNRKSNRVHDASAFLVHPGSVSVKRYPAHLNRIHKNKVSTDYLLEGERCKQRKREVRESPLLESVTFDPLDRDTIEYITLDPLNYRANRIFEHRAAERRRTMNKFPSKRPSTPENLKDLSAKHYLKTLHGKDAETEQRRNQQTSEVRRWDFNSPEDLVEEDDYTDSRTVSTRSSSTVYLIRTVKKPNRNGGSNGRTHAKKAEPESNPTVEPHRRREILEPVTLKDDPDEKDRGKRVRPKKTKRVKDSVTQTSEDAVQDDTPAAVENTQTMPRFITPRKQKRSVGLQTVIEEDLREQRASTNPTSPPIRIIRPSKTTVAIQTDIPKPSKPMKTTIGTQTSEPETASKATSVGSQNRGQKEKHDFSGQTENLPIKTTFDEKISERQQTHRNPPLRHSQEAPDVIWPTPAIQPLQSNDTMNTQREDMQLKRKPDAPQALATNGVFTDNQDQLVYGLQHEVRLLRHENYYLRQQMDYPIKPKGRLQKQNEEKILQIIRHLESQGTTGKLTSQIEEEMMHEAMIENEILRSENSDLHTTLDQTRRLQETLTTENEQLRKEIHLQQQQQQQQQQQRKMDSHDVDDGRRMVEPDDYFDRSQTSEADDNMEASRSLAPRSFTIRQGASESVPMTTTGSLRTHAATKQQTRIPKLTSDGRPKKSEMRN